MTTTASAKPAGSATYVIDTLRQGGDQVLAVYRQTMRFGMDAAGMWMETLGGLVPGAKAPATSATAALGHLAGTALDLAEGALKVQRELVSDAMGRFQAKS